ncbi:DUF6965 family protein [Parabacteroides distasonis]|uniref:DUF6965 family protein n=1 Tax=Parabacteroides distasonis TaxID=823 RepID=UPI0035668640
MNEELKQLLEWFDNYEITFNEIRLSQCQYIFDLRKFISELRPKKLGKSNI